jgi:TIR domain
VDTVDFFISYTKADKGWAEWIAWQLEANGYSARLQAWDFTPGRDFVHEMQQAAQGARRTIAVLSPAYLESRFGEAEWRAAFEQDPTGEKGLLVPVRVATVNPPALLASRIYIDLADIADEQTARTRLLNELEGVRRGRLKPSRAPSFPPETTPAAAPTGTSATTPAPAIEPPFPGTAQPPHLARSQRKTPGVVPGGRRPHLTRRSLWTVTGLLTALLVIVALMVAVTRQHANQARSQPPATPSTAVAVWPQACLPPGYSPKKVVAVPGSSGAGLSFPTVATQVTGDTHQLNIRLAGALAGRAPRGMQLMLLRRAETTSQDSTPEHNSGDGLYRAKGTMTVKGGCWTTDLQPLGYSRAKGLVWDYYLVLAPDAVAGQLKQWGAKKNGPGLDDGGLDQARVRKLVYFVVTT